MYLEIISPEATLFSGEVLSVSVPGLNGYFQMLNNHAPVVSSLKRGIVTIEGDLKISDEFKNKFEKIAGKTILKIESGTIEMSKNKLILLSD
ncbi:MAG: F-type H+-transporting ATPase subunit epsilon [Candidatus Marivariicella framensis]|jgi:F-type H+-transporting ATPase subunit epsilon|tara:strand:+ start:2937 stop:3212 length:276 start_codon:yes stop_codon:yes gene_type:complete